MWRFLKYPYRHFLSASHRIHCPLRIMGPAVSATDYSQLTAIISTANRPKSLRRVVQSLRRRFPELKILVADQSREPRVPKQADLVKVPAAVGRAAALNALLSRVRTPYFLLIDEQAELTADSQIDRLLELVVDDKLDVAAGDFMGCRRKFWLLVTRRPQPGHGLLEFAGDQLTLLPGHRTIGDGYAWCDLVHNFYVACTSKVRNLGGWDPDLENDEREEFFVRAHRHGLRVGLAPEVVASLWNEPAELQETSVDRKRLAVAKMALERMIDIDGRTITAPRRAKAA
ncbi:MAG: glycosyltransferase [Bythopirellula sp.]